MTVIIIIIFYHLFKLHTPMLGATMLNCHNQAGIKCDLGLRKKLDCMKMGIERIRMGGTEIRKI